MKRDGKTGGGTHADDDGNRENQQTATATASRTRRATGGFLGPAKPEPRLMLVLVFRSLRFLISSQSNHTGTSSTIDYK
jgi:hypothetical protein